MKKLMSALFMLMLLISASCGPSTNSNKKETTQDFLKTYNVVKIEAPSEYQGHWEGYVDESYVTILISADGKVKFTSENEVADEHLVRNDQGIIFVTDTNYKQILKLEINTEGYLEALVLYDQHNTPYYFHEYGIF